MADCQSLAGRLGDRIGRECAVPVFLYEAASRRPRSSLAAMREGGLEGLQRRMSTDPIWMPDFGPSVIHPTAGVVAIGARDILIAFNVFLNSPDLEAARGIARRIRESDDGLIGVKALGFYLAQRNSSPGLDQPDRLQTNIDSRCLRSGPTRSTQSGSRGGLERDHWSGPP